MALVQKNNMRKSYPIRARIRQEEAVNNILDWVNNDKSDSEDDSDIEESSEEEVSDFESGIEPSSPSPVEINSPDDAKSPSVQQPESIEDKNDSAGDNNDVVVEEVGPKRKGRPSGGSAKKRSAIADQTDIWKELFDGTHDERKHEFRFVPSKEPGVHANLGGDSIPFDCFSCLFDEEIQEQLVYLINDYANQKIQLNNPPTRRSMFTSWYPVTRHELLKLIAVIIAMGIDRRPQMRDYWSMDPLNYIPWYHEIFSRDKFEILYSFMLHVAPTDEKEKKDKIEPFLNALL